MKQIEVKEYKEVKSNIKSIIWGGVFALVVYAAYIFLFQTDILVGGF